MLVFESAACAAAIATFLLEANDSTTGQKIRPSINTVIDLTEKLLQEMFDEIGTHHEVMNETQVVRLLDRHDRLEKQVKALRDACPHSPQVKKLWSNFFGSNRKQAIDLLRQVQMQHALTLKASNSARGAAIRKNALSKLQNPQLPPLPDHISMPDRVGLVAPPQPAMIFGEAGSPFPPITAGSIPLQPVVTLLS